MTRETYRLVENIHPLYIINYIFFILRPCIQLPIIPTHRLSFFHPSTDYSTSLSLFLFPFHHFSHGTLLLFHIHLYHPSVILQPRSIFLFLLHIKCIQITHASLFPQVHTYNHRTSMLSFHSLLRANIFSLPSVLLLHQHFHLQNFHFFDFVSFVHTLSPFMCHRNHLSMLSYHALVLSHIYTSSILLHQHSSIDLPFHSHSFLSNK